MFVLNKERLTIIGHKRNVLLKGSCCNYGKISYSCRLKEGKEKLDAALNKLAEYENLEEQGLLLRVPCKINQDIYFVPSETNFRLNILNNMFENNRVYHQRICHIVYDGKGYYLECDKELEYGTGRIFIDSLYGEIWFLSESEAEEKLRKLEGADAGMGSWLSERLE